MSHLAWTLTCLEPYPEFLHTGILKPSLSRVDSPHHLLGGPQFSSKTFSTFWNHTFAWDPRGTLWNEPSLIQPESSFLQITSFSCISDNRTGSRLSLEPCGSRRRCLDLLNGEKQTTPHTVHSTCYRTHLKRERVRSSTSTQDCSVRQHWMTIRNTMNGILSIVEGCR